MEKEITTYESILITLFLLILLFLAVMAIKWRDTDNKIEKLRSDYERSLEEPTTGTTETYKIIFLSPEEPEEIVISYGGE